MEDTYSDPKWAQFRVLAVEHSLRACWSQPIRDRAGAPIGTFAVYHRQVIRRSSHQLAIAKTGAHLAAVAIENRRASEAMMRHDKRMEIAELVAHFGIWEVDLVRCNQSSRSVDFWTVADIIAAGGGKSIRSSR